MSQETIKSRSFDIPKAEASDINSKNDSFQKIIFWILLAVLALSATITFCLFFILKPSTGKTNFLLLGTAGPNHVGGDLTDTIVFTSIENQTGKTTVLSIPRDVWITSLRTKLNSVYHYEGATKTKQVIGQVLGQPIDYLIVVDFEIFKKIIDVLGNIEVNVERTLDDYKYPIPGKENDLCNRDVEVKCRYEHIYFNAGVQKMDGENALKFVRSRNAVGEEGTDFARAQRQQRVLLAIKNKILSLTFLLDPKKPISLYKIFFENIKTDIPQNQYFNLFKTVIRFRTKNLKMETLDQRFLTNPKNSKEKYDNQWVLIPKTGNWEEIQSLVSKLISVL